MKFEDQIDALVDEGLSTIKFASQEDVACFLEHRIKPKLAQLPLDSSGTKWKECYLITDHNGNQDSVYRIGFDPEYGKFMRTITFADGSEKYLGRFPSFDEVINEFYIP